MLRLERRKEASRSMLYATPFLAVLLTMAAGIVLFALIGKDPLRAISIIFFQPLTSVYGVTDGRWVDEESETVPLGRRGADRLAAEQAWSAFGEETGVACVRFRLAGIYGPGRNALVNLAEGKARRLVKPGQVFNRIHVADIAASLTAATTRPATRIYNLADDEPAPPQDVVAYAAGLMGIAPPPEIPFDEAELTPMARSFYGENKRVANRRIKEELGITLRYPTYREGLDALWREGDWRGG